MTVNDFAFTPADGLRNAVSFPTTPASEADARDQVQDISDQIRDYINTTIVAAINAKLDLTGGNLTGALASNNTLTGTALITTGLTGATQASRYVGSTTSGAPISGTFTKGDFVIDQTGELWVCTTTGTPGVWKKAGFTGTPATMASGTYTGDGTANRTIALGFTPKYVLLSGPSVRYSGNAAAALRAETFDGTNGFMTGDSGPSSFRYFKMTRPVTATNGFIVGDAGFSWNTSGDVINYIALG